MTNNRPDPADPIRPVPPEVLDNIHRTIADLGGAYEIPPDEIDAVGRTMFDSPSSRDHSVIVLMPPENIGRFPSQSLVHIHSKGDNRHYVGIVTAGPFAEPDGLRADTPLVITTTVRGIFLPRFHGRVHVEIINEILSDGSKVPPRYRPLPNSPVFALSAEDTAAMLQLAGDIPLGLAIGHDALHVKLSSESKGVLPRHTAILGTTGGGKSTTVSGLIKNFQTAGVATILFDTEGEYTDIDQPTTSEAMLAVLKQRGIPAAGVDYLQVLHLTGRDTTASPDRRGNKQIRPFGLRFDEISPYMLMEILELSEAQQSRFLAAYDLGRTLLSQFEIFPRRGHRQEDEQFLYELDDMERGYPELTLRRLYDIVRVCGYFADYKRDQSEPAELIYDSAFREADNAASLIAAVRDLKPTSATSWRVLQGRLARLLRLKIFDVQDMPDFEVMTRPGMITIIDLSDTESPELNNMVIATLLRGLQITQDDNYQAAIDRGRLPPRVVVIIEEAHEFLSAQRIQQMPALFQQVARIAKRGRKRWLGLVFVTQLPQHLPSEVLGLTNNYILHKIGDANVVSELKRAIGRIDDSLWDRLQNLAPGQAIVSVEGLSRPLIVSIDPTPCKLRMAD
jgi:hypothetical protein